MKPVMLRLKIDTMIILGLPVGLCAQYKGLPILSDEVKVYLDFNKVPKLWLKPQFC